MIKSLEELPVMEIGDIIELDGKQYAVTAILSIVKEESEGCEPSLTYKMLLERIIGDKDN